ncbi:hypothetical protein [Dokdonia sp.]|uniref:hypothetical protein n=1 Tax=Dokdonia sp. TaxID=2024995 RepID=UPI003264F5C8
MKHITLSLFLFLFCFKSILAQTNSYVINNQSYELKIAVEGTITLLWNIIDQEYYYFAKKGTTIIALTNTKTNNQYQEEYKAQLLALTANANMDKDRIDRVRLTLSNLRRFFNAYNKQVDPQYIEKKLRSNIEYRLGIFGGITNSIFRTDLQNRIKPQLVIDFELYDKIALPSHGIALQYKQTFRSNGFGEDDYQLSINHRFKFIKKSKFQVYLNTKLVTYTIFTRTFIEPGFIDFGLETITNLQSPFIFGFGTDIKLGKGYVSLNYNDVYSFIINNRDEFPVDATVGYRFVF